MEISVNIKALLDAQSRSLTWLSEKAGVTRPGLSKMLETGVFRSDTLTLIAKALGVPVSVLFGEKPAKESEKSGEDFVRELLTVVAIFGALWQLSTYITEAQNDPTKTKEDVLKDIQKEAQKMIKILVDAQEKVKDEIAETARPAAAPVPDLPAMLPPAKLRFKTPPNKVKKP